MKAMRRSWGICALLLLLLTGLVRAQPTGFTADTVRRSARVQIAFPDNQTPYLVPTVGNATPLVPVVARTSAQVRALTGSASQLPALIVVTDALTGGTFWLDANDKVSTDAMGMVLVTNKGLRYKRIYDQPRPDFEQMTSLLLETTLGMDATTALNPTSGAVYLARVIAVRSGTITRLGCSVTSAGLTLTAGAVNNGLALYDANGNRLALADGSTAFATTGDKLLPTDVSVSIVQGTVYYLAVCSSGTTTSQFQANLAAPMVNFNQTAAPWNYMRSTASGGLATTISLTTSQTDARAVTRPWIGGFIN